MMIKINKEIISDLLYCESKPILEIKIEYPQIEGHVTAKAERAFNSYYENEAKALNLRARNEIYRQALRDCKYARKNAYPFNIYSFIRTFNETFLSCKYASLYTDLYLYTGGAHGNTERKGYTWCLTNGRRMTLSEFFPKGMDYRKEILRQVKEQIAADQEGLYFENADKLAEQNFNPSNFFLTPDGIAIFYPLYTIAPYYVGIPVFIIKDC